MYMYVESAVPTHTSLTCSKREQALLFSHSEAQHHIGTRSSTRSKTWFKNTRKNTNMFCFPDLDKPRLQSAQGLETLEKNEFEFLMCSKCLFESMYGKLDVSIFVSCFGTEVWKTFNCRCFLIILNKDLEGLKICGFSDIVHPRCLSAWVCVCDWLTACVGWPQTKRIHSNIN